jgi:hypothetical protein
VRIVGYRADETLRGLLSFYVQRRMERTDAAAEVEAALAGPGPAVVLTMNKGEKWDKANVLMGAKGIAWSETMLSGDRRLAVIVANFVPPGAEWKGGAGGRE